MRHRVKKSHVPDHILKNLAVSVLLYEKVHTTKSRAKAVKPVIDRLICKAKTLDKVQASRYLKSFLPDTLAVKKVVQVLTERYKDRPSGFTSIVPAERRKSDAAHMADILLIP